MVSVPSLRCPFSLFPREVGAFDFRFETRTGADAPGK